MPHTPSAEEIPAVPESRRLAPGDVAPGFRLPDQAGRTVALSDYAGRRVVVYFYPRAATPGCTGEACDFRDSLGALAAAGIEVVGISRDDVPALAAFTRDEALTFPLLSDADLAVHRAYAVWGEKSSYGRTLVGVLRSTFVIGPDGRIELARYNVRAKGHVASLRKALGV